MHLVSDSQLKEPINSYNNQHLEYCLIPAAVFLLGMQWGMKAYILAVISTVPDLQFLFMS